MQTRANVIKWFRSCVNMASRQSSSELPPPYLSVVDDTYLHGFLHPPGYIAVSTGDNADETAANNSSENSQNTARQEVYVFVPMDSVLPSYDASNANISAYPSPTAAKSYPNCAPPVYTPAATPSLPRRQTLPPGENYIAISNRILAATGSDERCPTVRFVRSRSPQPSEPNDLFDHIAAWCCLCVVFGFLVLLCLLTYLNPRRWPHT